MTSDLVNMIDLLVPEEDPPLFNEECHIVEFIETCLHLMHAYVEEDPSVISDPDLHDILLEEVKDLFLDHFDFENTYYYNQEDWLDDLEELLEEVYVLFCDQIMPQHSVKADTVFNEDAIAKKLKKLAEKPQHQQRTKQWYEYRYNLITASSAHKAFDSQSSKNQLIYEKCQPLQIDTRTSGPVSLTSPLHWGQKYEPVSTLLYEDMFETKVADYGCIQHETYPFLGASPDGIVSDPSLPRYGRMLEIKNIVNREITGIPKREYWIQMQLQMETCDLDECDFLETKFMEYESAAEFISDGTFLESVKGEKKGIIMYFSTKDGRPHYIYKPIKMDQSTFDESWEEEQMSYYEQQGETWIKNIYWRLEKLSCVLVHRNKKWFQENVAILADVWATIEKERISGYEHRAPKKRPSSIKSTLEASSTGCLIGKNRIIVTKIRTESIDETMVNLDE